MAIAHDDGDGSVTVTAAEWRANEDRRARLEALESAVTGLVGPLMPDPSEQDAVEPEAFNRVVSAWLACQDTASEE